MSHATGFFDAYNARQIRTWGGDVSLLSPEEQKVVGWQALMPPVIEKNVVKNELDRCGFGSVGVEEFVEFTAMYSCVNLDCCGLVLFPSTASVDAWRRDVLVMLSGLLGQRFFPFASDPETSALFCLDRGREMGSSVPFVSVVDGDFVVERVFSGFGAMLSVLKKVLDSDVPLHVERGTQPDAFQRALVRELRETDPDGFGTNGWPNWYQKLVGGTDWT